MLQLVEGFTGCGLVSHILSQLAPFLCSFVDNFRKPVAFLFGRMIGLSMHIYMDGYEGGADIEQMSLSHFSSAPTYYAMEVDEVYWVY